jgi:hypothetical protein
MLQQELAPGLTPDPTYITISSLSAPNHEPHPFYLHPQTLALRATLDMFLAPKSGILSEQMGLGKTLICLALIVGTKHQISTPGVAIQDENDPMRESGMGAACTELAERYFPFGPFREGKSVPSDAKTVPSLAELVIHLVRASPHSIPFKNWRDKLPPHLWQPLIYSIPYFRLAHPLSSTSAPRSPRRIRRTASENDLRKGMRMLLTSGTLIVVPASLVNQWRGEINKHIEPGVLEVYVHDGKGKKSLPSAAELAEFDVRCFLTHDL